MKITVEFDNEAEFKSRIKNPRGGKDDNDTPETGNKAPSPILPPVQQSMQQPGAFQPSAGPAFSPPSGGFPGMPAGDPAVTAIVNRIVTRIDGAIASGQPVDQALNWFRGQCGPDAANATMDQIKTVFLHKLAMPTLENIAKLMNA